MDGLDPHEGRGMVSESLALWENGTQDFVKKILSGGTSGEGSEPLLGVRRGSAKRRT